MRFPALTCLKLGLSRGERCTSPARAKDVSATTLVPGYSSSCRSDEARPRERGHDLPEPPEALDLLLLRGWARELEVRPAAVGVQRLVEVVVAPAQRRVDALRDRMLLVQQEVAAAAQSGDDARRPRVEVGEPARGRRPPCRRGRTGRASARRAGRGRRPAPRRCRASARARRRAPRPRCRRR